MKRGLHVVGCLLLAVVLAIGGCGGGGGGGGFDPATGDFVGAGDGVGSGIGGIGGGDSVAGGDGICSGGTGIDGGTGGIGSGGTGATAASGVGSVDGFGSIVVNGVHWETDDATLRLEDTSELKLGMTVRVQGRMASDLANGTATLVISAADLRGAVSATTPGASSFEVAGVLVETDPSTVFAGGLNAVADLRVGDQVQVHGLAARGSPLRATRVEKLVSAQPPVVSGAVEALDRGARTFRIGGQTVSYAAATFRGMAASALAEGLVVRVRANVPGSPLRATTIEPWYPTPLTDGLRMAIAGLVTDYSGFGDFHVDGVPVNGASANWSGNTASVGVGARLEVTGTVSGGVLVATRVKVRHGGGAPDATPAYSATGPIGAYQSVSNFRVKGQRIDASGASFVGGTASDLRNGRKVGIQGSRVVDDVLVAERVEFLP